MLATTSPLRSLGVSTYSDSDASGDARIAFKSGKLVEYVEVHDPALGQQRSFTLDESINGEAHELLDGFGTMVVLTLEDKIEEKVAYSRSGRDYIARKVKQKVVKVDAAPAGSDRDERTRPAKAPTS